MEDVQFYLEDLKSKFTKINHKKYYLAYSGGKDSHFLYWFIKKYLKDNDIEIIAVNTRMEFPEISNRMYKYADRVLVPKLKPHEVIKKYGSPCFSKNDDEIIRRYQNGSRAKSTMNYIYKRNKDGSKTMYGLNEIGREMLLKNTLPKISSKCCDILKKAPIKEYEKQFHKKGIIGVMGSESLMRKGKYKSCFTKDLKFTPIWDLTDKLLDKIYKKYNIELPNIYNYISQTGCAGCPYGIGKNNTEIELQLMSYAKRQYVLSLFAPVYKIRGLNYSQTSIFTDFEKLGV